MCIPTYLSHKYYPNFAIPFAYMYVCSRMYIYTSCTHLQECPYRCRVHHAKCRTHVITGIVLLYATQLECTFDRDMHVAIGIVWEHQCWWAFFCPKDRRRRIAIGNARKLSNAIQTDLFVLRLHNEGGRCCG